ncbi:MAG: hypothetical protein ACHQT8_01305 [Chlamydiales bacterium]
MKKFLLIFLSLVILLVAAAPSLLSTRWGKNTLLNFFKNSDYEVSLDNLSLSWLGPQLLEGIKIQEKRNTFVFTCPKASSSAPLWPLLFGGRNFQDVNLVKPNLILQTASLGPEVSFVKFRKAAFIPSITLNPHFVPSVRKLHIEEGEFSLYGKQDLLARYHSLKIDAEFPSSHVYISGATTEGALVGNFHFEGKVVENALKADGELVSFPLQGVDALLSHFHPEAHGLILEGLGQSINLALDATLSQAALSCKLLANSSTLRAAIETQGNEDAIFLSKPGELKLALSPVFLKKAATLLPSLTNVSSSLNLRLAIDQFNLPISKGHLDFPGLSFSCSLQTDPVSLRSSEGKNEIRIENLNLVVKSRKFFDGVTALFDATTQVGKQKTPLHAQALITRKEETHLIELDASSPYFTLQPTKLILDEKQLTLLAPTSLRVTGEAGTLKAVLPAAISLKQGGSCDINVRAFSLPNKKKIEEMQLQLDFKTTPLVFERWYGLNDVELPTMQGKLDLSTFHALTLDIDLQPSPGHLLNFSTVADLDLARGRLHTTSHFTLSEQAKKWGSGKIVIDGSEIFTEKPLWNFLLNALGQEVNIKAALQLQDRHLKLKKEPIEIFFTLNKENFTRIEKWLVKKEPLFELSQPSILALTVSSLSIPIEKSWKEMAISMEGGFDKFAFQDKVTGEQVKMQNLHLSIAKEAAQAPLSFSITSQIASRDGTQGKISCVGTLPELTAQADRPTVDLTMDLIQFPTSILDLFTHLLGKSSIAPLFGEKLDATARIGLEKGSGPVDLNVKSSNTRLSFEGGVREGVLSLTQPAHAQILMTPELSQMILKEINPLSISSISSSNPFTLEIDSEGFMLPLSNWKAVSLTHARIELGQISTRNEGTLQITLGLLKSKEFTHQQQLNLWFTPIDFSIQKGEIAFERTEILLNQTFEIATWGNLHLPDETIDMVLGLTSQCLTKAFGIKNLPLDYVMQIPMKGKMNDVKLDTKSATAKIAALLLWQQSSSGDMGKGLLPGKGFSELLGRLATLPDTGTNTPPAKHPFPWEKYKPNGKERKSEKSNSTPPLEKKNKINKDDKPLKQLLKILR